MDDDASKNIQESSKTVDGNQDFLILEQQRRIEQEINDAIPLIGDLDPVEELLKEYICDEVYQTKIKDLKKSYKYIRKTRPDGNCFFRAFAFGYFELLASNPEEYKRFHEIACASIDNLLALGFPQFTVQDFYETVLELVPPSEDGPLFKDCFNRQSVSDYIVVYLRLVTSGQLQKESSFFENFIDGERSIASFCHQEVEPMYKESDHIHIIALARALGVGVHVKYMDRGEGSDLDFLEEAKVCVHLLYRPGHYDILYPLNHPSC